MPTDPETLYRELGRLIEAMPDLEQLPVTQDTHRWLAHAYALVVEVCDLSDKAKLKISVDTLGTPFGDGSAHSIRTVIYRAFSLAERNAPPGVAGAFIPVGDAFDAFSALSKILQTATSDVLIIDPYMDEAGLTEFGIAVPENVPLRLMAEQGKCKPTLLPAALKWIEQYGATRPLFVRLAPQRTLHDRAIFINHSAVWTLTQSLKDFAARSPAEIIRADDTAELKIPAYEEIWDASQDILV